MSGNEREHSSFGWLVMTFLAWLGLAGLTDAVIEWQSWFEQGVLQHWSSVKEWIVAIPLGWLPFMVPTWFIDYLAVGGVFMRSLPQTRWERPPELDELQPKWMKRADILISEIFIGVPRRLIALIIWPVIIPNAVAMHLLNFPHNSEEEKPLVRANYIGFYRRLIWCFVSFVPFLFVASTFLYKFG